MNGIFDIIFFAAVAIFLIYRLGSVLGKSDFDPENKAELKKQGRVIIADESKIVVNLKKEPEEISEIDKNYIKQVEEIRQFDSSFSLAVFLDRAKGAFEMIMKAYAEGDKSSLKKLLGQDVYKQFVTEIENRNKQGKILHNTLVSFDDVLVKDVVVEKRKAGISVQFNSEQVHLVKDKNGEVVEGDPSLIHKVQDKWFFSRDLRSKDPTWTLITTS